MEKYRISVFGSDVFGEPHCDQIEVMDYQDDKAIAYAEIHNLRDKGAVLFVDGERRELASYNNALAQALDILVDKIEKLEVQRAEKVRKGKEAFRDLGSAILRGHGIEPPA